MAGTKVGEGYIEITPRVQGLTLELRQKAQNTLNDWKDAKFTVSPKITGITKKWQEEVQKELNDKINGLTVKVAIKLDQSGIKATFNGVTIEAKEAGSNASDGLSDGFREATANIKRMMDEVRIAIQSGMTPERNGDVENRLGEIDDAYRKLADNIDEYSDREVSALRAGISQMEALQRRVASTVQTESNSVKKANDDIEKEIRKTIAETDRLVESTENAMKRYRSSVQGAFTSASGSFLNMDKEQKKLSDAFSNFFDPKDVQDAGKNFGSTLTSAIATTVRFGIARMVVGLPIALAGLGYSMAPVASAVSSLAAGFTLLGGQVAYAAAALIALPAALGAIAQGASVLGIAFYGIEEALGALKAEELQTGRATDQMADQMALANRRVADARRSLQEAQADSAERIAESEENLARVSESVAERISEAQLQLGDVTTEVADRIEDAQTRLVEAQENAAERVQGAQDRLADVLEAASEKIQDAQDRLASAQEDMASRIADAQTRLTDAIVNGQERIADAETALSRAREDSADRIADAQDRVSKAYEDGARRVSSAEVDNARAIRDVTEAQLSLTQAREDARERLEDLANTITSGKLGEEAAQFALADARDKLEWIQIDPNATDRDKAKADLDYREALQKLKEIQEKNGDLAAEQAVADANGIEGSKEVEKAKDAINDAVERQIKAEQDLAQARKDAAKAAIDAEKDLSDAREDAARSVGDAEDNLTDARKDAARAVADAEQALTDARVDSAKQVADAEKGLADARIDSAKQIADAEKAIVDASLEGSKSIASAEKDLLEAREDGAKRIADSEKALTNARRDGIRDVSDAEKDLAKTRADGSKQVIDAQRNLKEALEDIARSLDNQTAAAGKAESALNRLSPAAREFVLFLRDELIPKFEDVQASIQQAFLPPLQEALSSSTGLIEIFEEKLTGTATIFGQFARDVAAWLNTDESKNRIGEIMDSNNRVFEKLADAALKAGDGILILVNGSGPFLERMAGLVDDIAGKFRDMMIEAEKSGKLDELFTRIGDTIETFLRIAEDIGVILMTVFDEAYEPGKELLDLIADNVEDFKNWVTSVEGKNELRDWFERGKDVMIEVGRLIEDTITAFYNISKDVDFGAIIESIRVDVLPALVSVSKAFSGDNGQGLIFLLKGFSGALEVTAFTANLLVMTLEFVAAGIIWVGETTAAAWQGINGDVEGSNKAFADANTKFGESRREIEARSEVSTQRLKDAFTGLKDGTTSTMAEMRDKHGVAWTELERLAKDAATGTSKDVNSGFTGMVKDSDATLKDMNTKTGINMAGVRDKVVNNTESARLEAVKKFEEMKGGASTKFVELTIWLSQQKTPMDNAAKNSTSGLKSAGESGIQGFWDGMVSKWNGLIEWWNGALAGIEDAAKRILGIASPSTVMARVGDNVGEGLAIGIKRSMRHVSAAAGDMAKSVTGAWDGKLTLPVEANIPTYRPPAQTTSGQLKFNTQPVNTGPGKNYNITLVAAPGIPTERQMINALSYADSLYN